MQDTIVFYTFIALVIFFLWVEIYRTRHYIKGNIVEMEPSRLGVEHLISSRFKVQLHDGRIVEAEAFRCTMCMGGFRQGDQVFLTKKSDKYIIHLPFTLKKQSGTRSCRLV